MTNIFSYIKFHPFFGLYGAGGFGREIMPIKGNFDCSDTSGNVIKNPKSCFIESRAGSPFVNSIANFSEDDFLAQFAPKKYFNIAIADSIARETIANKLKKEWHSASQSCVQKIKCSFRILFRRRSDYLCLCNYICECTRWSFFHANIYSYVAHDCIVGNFVTFALGASCNGNVVIGDHAYIGTNASIRQGTQDSPIRIGSHALVGMGAVITKSVPDYAVLFGNPGKIIKYLNE
jgi:hypothetical protein